MKKFYTLLKGSMLLLLAGMFSISATAQVFYADNGSDPAYANGWKSGTNGGTGFLPWVIKEGPFDFAACTGWPDTALAEGKNVRLFVTCPPNTNGADLYVSGSFEGALNCGTNNWSGGGNACLKLRKLEGSNRCYWIDLNLDNQSEFKITRGAWTSVMKGSDISRFPEGNELANIKWNGAAEQLLTVEKWADLPLVSNNVEYLIGNPKRSGLDVTDTVAFRLRSTGAGYLNALRKFQTPMGITDILTFEWGFNWDSNPQGFKGFDLKSGDTTVYNVGTNGSSPVIRANGLSGKGLDIYGVKPVAVYVERINDSEYFIQLTGRDGKESVTDTLKTAKAIDGIDFYIGGQKDTSVNRDVYFNNFLLLSNVESSVSNLLVEKGFSVYPNPVAKGGTLQLAFRNRKAGQYTISLFDINGRRVQQSVVGHAGGNAVQRISVSSQLPSGTYFAEVMGNGKREHVKLIVQ